MIENISYGRTDRYEIRMDWPVVETTWHSVEKFFNESPGFSKGDRVEVVGRLKNQRYTNADGVEMCSTYVIAKIINKIETRLTFEE